MEFATWRAWNGTRALYAYARVVLLPAIKLGSSQHSYCIVRIRPVHNSTSTRPFGCLVETTGRHVRECPEQRHCRHRGVLIPRLLKTVGSTTGLAPDSRFPESPGQARQDALRAAAGCHCLAVVWPGWKKVAETCGIHLAVSEDRRVFANCMIIAGCVGPDCRSNIDGLEPPPPACAANWPGGITRRRQRRSIKTDRPVEATPER